MICRFLIRLFTPPLAILGPFSRRAIERDWTIYGQLVGPARHRPVPAWPDSQRAGTARRVSRAMPHRATGLAFGPGTALCADFRIGPTRKALPESQVVPAHGLLPFAFIISQTDNSSQFHNSYIHSSHQYIITVSYIHKIKVQNLSDTVTFSYIHRIKVEMSDTFTDHSFIHSLIHIIKVQSRQTT